MIVNARDGMAFVGKVLIRRGDRYVFGLYR